MLQPESGRGPYIRYPQNGGAEAFLQQEPGGMRLRPNPASVWLRFPTELPALFPTKCKAFCADGGAPNTSHQCSWKCDTCQTEVWHFKNVLPCVNSKVSKMMLLSPDSAGRCCRRGCHLGFIDHTKQLLYFQLLMDVRRRKRTLERYYMQWHFKGDYSFFLSIMLRKFSQCT